MHRLLGSTSQNQSNTQAAVQGQATTAAAAAGTGALRPVLGRNQVTDSEIRAAIVEVRGDATTRPRNLIEWIFGSSAARIRGFSAVEAENIPDSHRSRGRSRSRSRSRSGNNGSSGAMGNEMLPDNVPVPAGRGLLSRFPLRMTRTSSNDDMMSHTATGGGAMPTASPLRTARSNVPAAASVRGNVPAAASVRGNVPAAASVRSNVPAAATTRVNVATTNPTSTRGTSAGTAGTSGNASSIHAVGASVPVSVSVSGPSSVHLADSASATGPSSIHAVGSLSSHASKRLPNNKSFHAAQPSAAVTAAAVAAAAVKQETLGASVSVSAGVRGRSFLDRTIAEKKAGDRKQSRNVLPDALP